MSTADIFKNDDCLLKAHPPNKTNILSIQNSSILMM